MSSPAYGRRQAFLILLGILYMVIGSTYAVAPTPQALQNATAALRLVPTMHVWGTAWALCGLVACVTSSWPRGRDMLGFGALAGWSWGWGALAFLSTLWYGVEHAWISGLIYATFGTIVMIVSGMYGRSDHARAAQ